MEITRRTLLQAGALLAATAPSARPAPSDRITVGVIGTGARGQELMDALQQHPQAEIVGLVDAYKGRLDRALSRVKGGAGRAKIYPTHRELLAEKSIDAVVVAIPDHLHKAVVVDALRAGKDVYCEKPLTYTPAEGLEIIAAAAAGRRIVQVGSQGMLLPPGVPMIIIYKISPLSYVVGKLFIRIKNIGLVNIIAGKTIVPELIQGKAKAQSIASEAIDILTSVERKKEIINELATIRAKLGKSGAAIRAAQLALDML